MTVGVRLYRERGSHSFDERWMIDYGRDEEGLL